MFDSALEPGVLCPKSRQCLFQIHSLLSTAAGESFKGLQLNCLQLSSQKYTIRKRQQATCHSRIP